MSKKPVKLNIAGGKYRNLYLPVAVVGFAVLMTALIAVSDAAANITSARSGDWTSPSTWTGGQVPGSNDSVTIAAGHNVTLNTSPTVSGVTIRGTLTFDPDQTAVLQTDENVNVEGILVMKPSSPNFDHTIRFININEGAFAGGGYADFPNNTPDPLASDVGLWVKRDGALDLKGTPRRGWTYAADGLTSGATTITLREDPVGWQVGDEIVVTPTKAPTESGFSDNFEERTITAINGRTVTLNSGLSDNHPKVNNMWTAEVANLTRNVNIEGTPSGLTHTLINSNQPQNIRYVDFRYFGPRVGGDVTDSGRYGLHFHHSYDGARGSLVEGIVLRDGDNHAVVPHQSHGIDWRDVVTYNTINDAVWWDQRSCTRCDDHHPTFDNVFDHVLVAYVKPEFSFRGFRLTGFVAGVGANNTIKNSVATGVQGNLDSSGFIWPESGTGDAWIFEENNISHNNAVEGIFTWQNTGEEHPIRDFALYHNGGYGIDHGAYVNQYEYTDAILYGNREGGIGIRSTSWGGNDRLRFTNVIIDGANISNHAIEGLEHTVFGGAPVFLTNVAIRNFNAEPVNVTGFNRDSRPKNSMDVPDQYVFNDVDYNGNKNFATFASQVHPDSFVELIRNGTTVEKHTGSGTTSTRSISGNVPNPIIQPIAPAVDSSSGETPAPDTENPTSPTNLNSAVAGTNITLSWNASTDNVGVSAYEILRNNSVIASVNATNFTDSALSPGTYTYTVRAKDAAGNTSPASGSTQATVAEPEDNPAADLNGDTRVNILDLSILLTRWNTSDSQADLNGDNTVNILDLSAMLSQWAP